MVLLIMAIAASLAAPAFARFGTDPPTGPADKMIGLLRDARKASIDFNATVTLRMDPKTLKYQIDTSGVRGSGRLAEGTLDMGLMATLESTEPRLRYVFRPSGVAFADTVIVRGGEIPLIVRVDPWSGVARADSL